LIFSLECITSLEFWDMLIFKILLMLLALFIFFSSAIYLLKFR
jgi:hypothetical protein